VFLKLFKINGMVRENTLLKGFYVSFYYLKIPFWYSS